MREEDPEGFSADILDLINRLKAENESLADHNKQLRYDRNQIKSEAYKEFAERLKEHSINIDVSFGYGKEHYTEAVTAIEIDNLLAELTPTLTINKLPHNSLCETDTYEGWKNDFKEEIIWD